MRSALTTLALALICAGITLWMYADEPQVCGSGVLEKK